MSNTLEVVSGPARSIIERRYRMQGASADAHALNPNPPGSAAATWWQRGRDEAQKASPSSSSEAEPLPQNASSHGVAPQEGFNRKGRMPKLVFNSEQQANDYKARHKLHQRKAEPVAGTGKWALNFPIEAHITVNDGAPAGMRIRQGG